MPVHDPWSSKAKTLSNRTNQGMFLLLVFLFALKKQNKFKPWEKKSRFGSYFSGTTAEASSHLYY